MKLYHGTSEAVARLALTEGLKPRSESGEEGNWEDHPSNPDHVYLTTAYAGYFAACASEERWGIIEVDTDELDLDCFFPDEDFLEQATRGKEFAFNGLSECRNMEERTSWFKEHLFAFAHHWQDSLQNLGNCSFEGVIPTEAISRVALFDPAECPPMAIAAMDPMISIMNFRLCSRKYTGLTRWLAGYEVAPIELLAMAGQPEEIVREFYKAQIEGLAQAMEGHPGVEVIHGA